MFSDKLFSNDFNKQNKSPLADILRPRTLDDFFGQRKILNKHSLLRNAILKDKVGNTIFTGPPGVGKTTLIDIISLNTRSELIKLNAVLSGIKELRLEILNAKNRYAKSSRKTILFIDEVHRLNAAQQDALLPSIEDGTITFLGATTENPFFAINKALISRLRIFKLTSLDEEDLRNIINRVVVFYKNLENPHTILIDSSATNHLIKYANGDARNLINALELIINTTKSTEKSEVKINLSIAEESIQNKNIAYDKNGQNHFDVISAFIKSIRGSDPDATLFWLANMIEAGEDPNYIFRRLLISASEDVGLADPNAIVVVNACHSAFEKVGFPEASYFLAQASLYLALSTKSNSNKSIFKAIELIKSHNYYQVPNHLRNNASNYKNPHNLSNPPLDQSYMPENLKNCKIWENCNNGWEKLRFDALRKSKNN